MPTGKPSSLESFHLFHQEDPDKNARKSSKTVRLFFALWPDKLIRKQIVARSKSLELERKGRQMQSFNLHITLHFIGNTTLENLHCLKQQAASVKSSPFSIELDQFGSFKKPGIVWLGCTKIPAELHRLHRKLGQHIKHCDYEPDKRQYRPHITLYRKARLAEQDTTPEPVIWTVDSFSLIRSEPVREGVIYREIQRYPLSVQA